MKRIRDRAIEDIAGGFIWSASMLAFDLELWLRGAFSLPPAVRNCYISSSSWVLGSGSQTNLERRFGLEENCTVWMDHQRPTDVPTLLLYINDSVLYVLTSACSRNAEKSEMVCPVHMVSSGSCGILLNLDHLCQERMLSRVQLVKLELIIPFHLLFYI